MDRLIGIAAVAMGLFMIWNRRHMADQNIRQQNGLCQKLPIKRRYGEKEYRHNLRAT
jgi:hypothetical protein